MGVAWYGKDVLCEWRMGGVEVVVGILQGVGVEGIEKSSCEDEAEV